MSYPPGPDSPGDPQDPDGGREGRDPWATPSPTSRRLRSSRTPATASSRPTGSPYGQPQYGQPAYGQPQYGQPAYGQPQYGYG